MGSKTNRDFITHTVDYERESAPLSGTNDVSGAIGL